MIRRYNYTDRLRIPRENVFLTWLDDKTGTLQFDATINLELERLLDPQGCVFVEAYSGPVVMRFPWGTVAHPQASIATKLTDFPPGLKPLFRVRVVDPGDERRILAWADRIAPLTPDEIESGRRSILPVETVDLGQRIWNLRIESNTFFLQLNSAIREPQDITVIARDADFIGLVYPAVIRQILAHLLCGPESESVESNHEWLVFATALAGAPPPDINHYQTDDEFRGKIDDWTDDVIEKFCNQQRAAEMFTKFKKESEVPHG